MAVGQLELPMVQGATFRRRLIWRGPSPDGGVTPGPLRDLTDCTAKMSVAVNVGGDPIWTLTTEDGGIELGGTEGTVSLLATSDLTWLLVNKRYVYDLYVYFPGDPGDDVRLVEGKIPVDPSTTKPTDV